MTVNKADYLAYIDKAIIHAREHEDETLRKWREAYDPNKFLGMYTPPGTFGAQAHLEGFMYRTTGDLIYARAAREHLLALESCMSIVSDEERRRHPEFNKSIPAMDALFQAPHYIYGYLNVKDSGLFDAAEKQTIERMIASSVDFAFIYPEWGAHNRSMLRVWAAMLALEAIGDGSADTANWRSMCEQLAQASFGNWSIEDAQAYMNLWLISTMEYARYDGREEEYYRLPQTKYYFDYIARLITPYGQVPDYGDSNFNSTWYIWLPILEKGAAVYQDGRMKYAASKLWEFAMRSAGEDVSLTAAAFLPLACAWADDNVAPVRPEWGSEEVLEDVIGKKIVFRESWDDDAAYLLLNYRDEGDYARIPRDYLRATLSVRAEKMHHGHSDENAVILMTSGQQVLLHDGGYRENVPNGKYRADLYHNRLVFRSGNAWQPEQESLYDFLHDDGVYRGGRTEKLHFQRFSRLDFSRTRLHDPARQLVWDRMITYLKREQVFIVVDWVQSEVEQTLTTANLWHTGAARQLSQNAFETRVPYIHRGVGCQNPYRNEGDLSLLVEFPDTACATGVEPIQRNYGAGIMVFEAETSHFAAGEMACYITVLTACPRADDLSVHAGKLQCVFRSDSADTLGLVYRGATELHLAYKLDLQKGMLEQPPYDGAPRYDWESGKIDYGELVTDADFAYVDIGATGVGYGMLNGSRLYGKGKELFAAPDHSTYAFDKKKWFVMPHKWRSWEGVQAMASDATGE